MLLLVLVIPLEFGDICKPFLIWSVCLELSVQYVLCNELRIICLSCATEVPVFDRRFDAFLPAYPKNSFVIDFNVMQS